MGSQERITSHGVWLSPQNFTGHFIHSVFPLQGQRGLLFLVSFCLSSIGFICGYVNILSIKRIGQHMFTASVVQPLLPCGLFPIRQPGKSFKIRSQILNCTVPSTLKTSFYSKQKPKSLQWPRGPLVLCCSPHILFFPLSQSTWLYIVCSCLRPLIWQCPLESLYLGQVFIYFNDVYLA